MNQPVRIPLGTYILSGAVHVELKGDHLRKGETLLRAGTQDFPVLSARHQPGGIKITYQIGSKSYDGWLTKPSTKHT